MHTLTHTRTAGEQADCNVRVKWKGSGVYANHVGAAGGVLARGQDQERRLADTR